MKDKPDRPPDLSKCISVLAKKYEIGTRTLKVQLRCGAAILLNECYKALQDRGASLTEFYEYGEDFGLKRDNLKKYLDAGKDEVVFGLSETPQAGNNSGIQITTLQHVIKFLCATHPKFKPLKAEPCTCVRLVYDTGIRFTSPELEASSSLASFPAPLPERHLRILVLGTHDDAEFCAPHIQELLEGKMGHSYKVIQCQQDERPEEIVQKINRRIRDSHYDAFVVVIGSTYGVELGTPDDEGEPLSRRHHEFRNSNLTSFEKKVPVFVLAAEPGSELENEFEKGRRKLIKTLFDNDEDLLERDRQKFARLKQELPYLKVNPAGEPLLDLQDVNEMQIELHCRLDARFRTRDCFESRHQHHESFSFAVAEAKGDFLEAAKAVFRKFEESSRSSPLPGLCVLVHSRLDRLANAATRKIIEEKLWPVEKEVRSDFSEGQRNIGDSVQALLWSDMDEQAPVRATANIEKLADAILSSSRPHMLVLSNVHYSTTLETFIEDFWVPLYQNIAKKISQQKMKRGRWAFIGIIVSSHTYEVKKYVDELANSKSRKAPDYEKFICLPEIKN